MRKFIEIPNLIKAAQLLFVIMAGIWSLLAVISLTRMTSSGSSQLIAALIVAVLMLGNAGAFLMAGIVIGKPNRLFYFFGVMVLAINIILTVTDQFGVLDLITLVIDMVILGLLIATRSYYLVAK